MVASNDLNISQSGLVKFDGISTFTGVTVTQHDVLLGGSSNTITSISSLTSGFVLTSNGTGVDPSFQAAASGGITTINGDSGSITGSTVTIYADQTANQAGAFVGFINSGTTSTLQFTDPINKSTFVGLIAGSKNASTNFDCGFGWGALERIGSLGTTTDSNCAFGAFSQNTGTANSNCCSLGSNSLQNLNSGIGNLALGHTAGASYSGSESYNIILSSGSDPSVNGESNILRIGKGTGTSAGNLNETFIAGINGNTVSNTLMVTINSSTDQLGTAPLASGSLVKLSTVAAAVVPTITFDNTVFNATYKVYMIAFTGIADLGGAGVLSMVVSNDNGSNYSSTGYNNNVMRTAWASAITTNIGTTTTFNLSQDSNGNGCSGELWLYGFGGSSFGFPNINGQFSCDSASFVTTGNIALVGPNAVQFSFDTGDLYQGTITVYGVVQ